MSNGKDIILSIVGLINKILYKMSQYFPESYRALGGNLKVELDFFSYATKAELRKQQELILCNKIEFSQFINWSR